MSTLPALRRYKLADYVAEPGGLRRSSAASRGWLRGWPDACPSGSQLATPRIVRPRDGHVFGRPMDRRLAPVVGWALQATMDLHHEYRDLLPAWELRTANERDGGLGGVACRAIKGSNPPRPSNHSNGTAKDINTKSNPMFVADAGVPVAQKRFQSTQSPILVRLLAAGNFDWGGWWVRYRSSYSDAMHVDYLGRPQDVARDFEALKEEARKIEAELEAQRPKPKPTPPKEDPDVDAEKVKAVQELANDLGWKDARGRPLVVDGIWGPLTQAAVDGLAKVVAFRLSSAEQATAEAVEKLEASKEDAQRIVDR